MRSFTEQINSLGCLSSRGLKSERFAFGKGNKEFSITKYQLKMINYPQIYEKNVLFQDNRLVGSNKRAFLQYFKNINISAKLITRNLV